MELHCVNALSGGFWLINARSNFLSRYARSHSGEYWLVEKKWKCGSESVMFWETPEARNQENASSNAINFQFQTMLPWFFCFLSLSSQDLEVRSFPEFHPQPSLWWNPIDTVRKLDGFRIEEGDILVPASPNSNLKNAIKSKKYLWENGIIPYEFGEDFTCFEKNQVLDAMKVLEANTCIKFVEKDKEETFISFQKEKNGCYAPIGRLGGNEGALPVNLQSPECLKERGIIEHELLHVAGLFHEQSRPDRDDFVTIHWCNIEPYRQTDFLKGNTEEMTTFDLPYDYGSIMHYPKWAFSRNGQPTITAKGNPDMTLGQRQNPSPADFEKIVKMYACRYYSFGLVVVSGTTIGNSSAVSSLGEDPQEKEEPAE